jgi:hypothetical protein
MGKLGDMDGEVTILGWVPSEEGEERPWEEGIEVDDALVGKFGVQKGGVGGSSRTAEDDGAASVPSSASWSREEAVFEVSSAKNFGTLAFICSVNATS